MKYILFTILLGTTMLFSCEKDYYYDVDCNYRGGDIGGWEKGDSTHITTKDSTRGFNVEVKEWGDSIKNDIKI